MSEFAATTTDINNYKHVYETLLAIYHRYKLSDFKDVFYIDSSKGELLPFFKLHSQHCNYHNYITDQDTIIKNTIFNKFDNITSVNVMDDDSINKTNLIFCNNINILKQIHMKLNIYGYIVFINGNTNTNTNTDILKIPGIERIFVDESTNINVFKKVETLNTIHKMNEFNSLLPVKNKYELLNLSANIKGNPDIEINIYKVSDNRVKLIMFRFDDEKLYDENIEVKIYDNQGPLVDHIVVKFNDATMHASEHDVKVRVVVDASVQQNTLIPKTICQTLDNDVVGEMHIRTVKNLKCKNPEYKYYFFDATTRRRFIKENFDSTVLETYDGFVSGAFKADIFRYCWLYMHGGFYVDCKMINRKSLRDIISTSLEHFIFNDRIPDAYQNCVIGVQPKDINILNCINECIVRFERKINHRVSFGSLYHTGPYLFYACMKEYEPSAKFKGPFDNRDYKDGLIVSPNENTTFFNVWFKDYYNKYNSIHKKPIWSEQWAKNEIYYSDKYAINGLPHFYIYVHPNQLKPDELERVEFIFENKEIRNNVKDKIKCKLIDDMQNIENLIIVNKK